MKNNSILIKQIFPTSGMPLYIKNIALILFGSFLLAVSAKVQVPFWPVPMTMQTFVVFIIGMTCGWRLSFFTLLGYIFEGALGLPVFATGSGLLYLMGPTAGYIYGMLLAVIVIGFLSEKGFSNSYLMSLISLLIGSVIIFSFGVGYLGSIIGYDKAINAGLLPFIPSELFKIALAVALIPSLSKFIK
jgi:biotin transport system substrate-specific component